MNTAKHTPGPWVAEGDDNGYMIVGPRQCYVADICSADGLANDNNANLIAAAPAMYAESKTLCSLVCAFMNDNRLYDGQLIQAIHNLETALAQAEGRHS